MRPWRWPRWFKLSLLILGLVVLALNGSAWMQAYRMTHFVAAGTPPPTIESMSWPAKVQMLFTGVAVPRPENVRTPADLDLPYEVHSVQVSAAEYLEAWFVPHPRPRGVVLLFHSYAASKESLLAPAAAFHQLGYGAFLVDFRGSGGSSGDDTTLGVREAADVALSVAHVRRTWPGQPLVLYGTSMGSAAVLRAVATAGVRPDAVILESPFDRLLSTTRNRFQAMGLPAFPAAELLLFWGGVQQGFDGFAHNPVDYAAGVDCPALLLHGERDPRVTVEQAGLVFERLPGPKEMVLFPGAGHEMLIAAAPGLWYRSVARFLEQSLMPNLGSAEPSAC